MSSTGKPRKNKLLYVMSNPNTQHYQHQIHDVFEKYSKVCEWFDDLGFTYTKTRYGIYKRHFDDFDRFSKNSELLPDDLLPWKRSFDNAYVEANEIIRVQNDLKQINSEEFFDQIKKVVSGQEFRGNSDNDQARDFLFELSVAARFIRAGYHVSLTGVCDVVAKLGAEGVLFIECKRVKSEKNLAANVKKANKQIAKRVKSSISHKVAGLVAVNITDLIPKVNNFFPDTPGAGTAIHRGISKNFNSTHIREFAEGMTKDALGVMCESSTMMYFSKESLTPRLMYSRHTSFLPYKKGSTLEHLAPKICNQDIS